MFGRKRCCCDCDWEEAGFGADWTSSRPTEQTDSAVLASEEADRLLAARAKLKVADEMECSESRCSREAVALCERDKLRKSAAMDEDALEVEANAVHRLSLSARGL